MTRSTNVPYLCVPWVCSMWPAHSEVLAVTGRTKRYPEINRSSNTRPTIEASLWLVHEEAMVARLHCQASGSSRLEGPRDVCLKR
jgi:hypothetical protein